MESFSVRVCPETSEMLQKLAFKKDISWGGTKRVQHKDAVAIDFETTRMYYGTTPSYTVVTVEEAVKRLTAEDEMKINGNTVTFHKDGIKINVDGTSYKISKSKIKKIYDLVHA